MLLKRLAIITVAILLLCSCATMQHRAETYKGEPDALFKATIQAIKENGFNVTTFDPETGVVDAVVSGPFGPDLRLNAKVVRNNVDITITPRKGIMADMASMMQAIHSSIKTTMYTGIK